MTDEERNLQTKKIYSLKMWDCCTVKADVLGEDDIINFTFARVPGGWIVNDNEFVPIGKVEQIHEHKTSVQI